MGSLNFRIKEKYNFTKCRITCDKFVLVVDYNDSVNLSRQGMSLV